MREHPSEHKIQCDLVSELKVSIRPEVVFCSIPNGGLRNWVVAKQMKAEGLRPGMPDLLFADENGVAWLELKNNVGRLSEEQIGMRTKLESLGHRWAMARSVEEGMAQVGAWGMLE